MNESLDRVSRRVGQFDAAAADPARPADLVPDLERAAALMAESMGPLPAQPAPPEDADRIASGCRLLARVGAAAPGVAYGPLDLKAQFWIGTGRPQSVPAIGRRLSRHRFTPVSAAVDGPASTKPFGMGLYTSTGVAGTYGMWHTYLEIGRSSLFPQPWHVWAVLPSADARVKEIDGAADWADFVARYPRPDSGLVYPDWPRIAVDHDAVHTTFRAVTAAEGITLRSRIGVTAPLYWDVESTFWLRWCFRSVRLVTVSGTPA